MKLRGPGPKTKPNSIHPKAEALWEKPFWNKYRKIIKNSKKYAYKYSNDEIKTQWAVAITLFMKFAKAMNIPAFKELKHNRTQQTIVNQRIYNAFIVLNNKIKEIVVNMDNEGVLGSVKITKEVFDGVIENLGKYIISTKCTLKLKNDNYRNLLNSSGLAKKGEKFVFTNGIQTLEVFATKDKELTVRKMVTLTYNQISEILGIENPSKQDIVKKVSPYIKNILKDNTASAGKHLLK